MLSYTTQLYQWWISLIVLIIKTVKEEESVGLNMVNVWGWYDVINLKICWAQILCRVLKNDEKYENFKISLNWSVECISMEHYW